jgi:phosphate transport system permease protein
MSGAKESKVIPNPGSGSGKGLMRGERSSSRARADVLGLSFTWLCGGALALNLLLILGLLLLIAWQGLIYFWQGKLLEVRLDDGTVYLGELNEREEIPALQEGDDPLAMGTRIRLKTANRDVTGADFVWVDEARIVERSYPEHAVVLERLEWGNFNGFMVELRRGDEVLASGAEPVWEAFGPLHDRKLRERQAVRRLEKGEIGDINARIERLRLDLRKVDIHKRWGPEEKERRRVELERRLGEYQSRYNELAERLFQKRRELMAETLVVETADGAWREVAVGAIVRAIQPNTLGLGGSLALYGSRLWEFVSDDPRESNTEGGIFPAIFGTVMMVFIMSFFVAPFGVLAALYLREYAKQGPLVRIVRIAVNNLAGVPSIVFGMFGLGFFVYLIGGSIDRLFYPEALPTPTFGTGGILWASLTLALLTVPVVIVATEEGLASVPRIVREGSLALGATKFETTWKVVIPAAAPGILTGLILAMARAAGEVAPLMIVGMVKLAPTLPIDGTFPFVHLERKFMHLGFHIYDVGFQSPNVEATKPLVFATAFLLILVVTLMNLVAIAVRNHLRRKYASSEV